MLSRPRTKASIGRVEIGAVAERGAAAGDGREEQLRAELQGRVFEHVRHGQDEGADAEGAERLGEGLLVELHELARVVVERRALAIEDGGEDLRVRGVGDRRVDLLRVGEDHAALGLLLDEIDLIERRPVDEDTLGVVGVVVELDGRGRTGALRELELLEGRVAVRHDLVELVRREALATEDVRQDERADDAVSTLAAEEAADREGHGGEAAGAGAAGEGGVHVDLGGLVGAERVVDVVGAPDRLLQGLEDLGAIVFEVVVEREAALDADLAGALAAMRAGLVPGGPPLLEEGIGLGVELSTLQLDVLGLVEVREDELVGRVDPDEPGEVVGVGVEREEVNEVLVSLERVFLLHLAGELVDDGASRAPEANEKCGGDLLFAERHASSPPRERGRRSVPETERP